MTHICSCGAERSPCQEPAVSAVLCRCACHDQTALDRSLELNQFRSHGDGWPSEA